MLVLFDKYGNQQDIPMPDLIQGQYVTG